MSFSEKLQVLRKEHNMSQEQLADKLNVSRQAVSKWESGASYPEMEKLIEICKIFDCSIDDLTNENIKELGKTSTQKNTINNIVDEILYITRKTISMLSNISTKDFFKMLFGLLVTILIIQIIKIPVNSLYNLISGLLLSAGRVGAALDKILYVIIYGAYLILSVILFIYVYKTKYLDNCEEIKKEIIIEKKQENNEKVQEKIMVTNTPSNKNKYAIFTVLGNIFILFIKMIVILFTIPFIATLIGFSTAFIITLGLIFKGVFFFGITLGFLGLVIINVLFLYLVISFIFNRKVNLKYIIITFLATLVSLGIASGITILDLSSFKYINNNPYIQLAEKTHEFAYNENMKIDFVRWTNYFDEISYEENEELKDKVQIIVSYPQNFLTYEIENDNEGFIRIHCKDAENYEVNIAKSLLNDLRKKEIHNYTNFNDIKITIKSSQANIEQIVKNTEEYTQIQREDSMRQYYESRIDELEAEIASLRKQMDENESLVTNCRADIERYQDEIENYKNKINDIKESIN